MTDYKTWVDRASTFVRSLSYLPGKVELSDQIQASVSEFLAIDSERQSTSQWLMSPRCTIPEELRTFLRNASQRCNFHYKWQPPPGTDEEDVLQNLFPAAVSLQGGADFCESARYFVYDHIRGEDEDRESGLLCNIRGEDEDRESGRVGLCTLDNSDKICLKLGTPRDSRQVVYVRGSDPSNEAIVWQGFDDFLMDWETLNYIYPSFSNLAHWLTPESTRLEVDSVRTDQLRSLLTSRTE